MGSVSSIGYSSFLAAKCESCQKVFDAEVIEYLSTKARDEERHSRTYLQTSAPATQFKKRKLQTMPCKEKGESVYARIATARVHQKGRPRRVCIECLHTGALHGRSYDINYC
jgi:hypothetical protein